MTCIVLHYVQYYNGEYLLFEYIITMYRGTTVIKLFSYFLIKTLFVTIYNLTEIRSKLKLNVVTEKTYFLSGILKWF